MDRLLTLFTVFLLLASPTLAIEGPTVDVSLAKYDPFPAEPGKYVNVWLKVENSGGDDADSVFLELLPEYPFQIISNEDTQRDIGILGGQDYELVKYKLIVDSNAIDGDNELTVRYRTCDMCMWVTEELDIEVAKATNSPEIELIPVSIEPEPYWGGTSEISLDIVNIAPGTAYYVIVEIRSNVASIEPQKIYVGNLEPDDIDSLDFDATFENVEPGVYPITFTLKYKDNNYDEYERNQTMEVRVNRRPQDDNKEQSPILIYAYIVIAIIAIWFARKKGWLKPKKTFAKIMAA